MTVNSQIGTGYVKHFFCVVHGRHVLSAQMLELSLSGVETVLRVERGVWSMDK